METRFYPIAVLAVVAAVSFFIGYFFALGPFSQNVQTTQVLSLKSQITDLQAQVKYLQSQVAETRLEVIGGKADTFEAKFHDLLQEHTFLLINTIRRSADSSNSFNESYNALQENINEVSDELAKIYGEYKADEFKELWKTKINNFINYTKIVKSDGALANSTLDMNMEDYEESSATFWSTLNPYIDKATIRQLITDHVNNVKEAVDFWEAKNYKKYFLKLHDSYSQIGSVADVIVVGIVAHHPEQFA